MMMLSLSNRALVHAPGADVNGEVVACVSPAQIATDPHSVALKIYDLAMNFTKQPFGHAPYNTDLRITRMDVNYGMPEGTATGTSSDSVFRS